MIKVRKPLDGFGVLVMLVLCLCFGLQQVAVVVAAKSIHPVMQMALRCGFAALLVSALIWWRGGSFLVRDGTLWPGLAAGVLFAIEFLCVSVGLSYTTASHMVVFLYTAPIFTVLGLHYFVLAERIGRIQWLGVLLAFGGIAYAFSDSLGGDGTATIEMLQGDVLAVLAGLSWAATTIVVRTTVLSEAAPTRTLLYQLVVACVLLLGIAGGLHQSSIAAISGIAWASLLFQSVIVAFACFLAWFWMLRHYLASRVSVFSFLTPLFGVAFGVVLLNDPLSLRFAAGAVLVLVGVVMVNLRRA
ncbi:MAG: DMT family transporter [Glaciimonas sp.]|nr:DMT family transporter [Glaciimonas sp.]